MQTEKDGVRCAVRDADRDTLGDADREINHKKHTRRHREGGKAVQKK